jgi:inactivated superfamily I helicase
MLAQAQVNPRTIIARHQVDATQFVDLSRLAFTLINALSTVLQLERALIENRYFEVFEGHSTGAQRTLALLADCTRTHQQKLHRFWQDRGERINQPLRHRASQARPQRCFVPVGSTMPNRADHRPHFQGSSAKSVQSKTTGAHTESISTGPKFTPILMSLIHDMSY